MSLFLCGSYLLLILLIGYVAVCAIFGSRPRRPIELLALCFSAGFGLLGMLLFDCSVLGFRPTRVVLFAIAAFSLIALFILRHYRRTSPFNGLALTPNPAFSPLQKILAVVAGVLLLATIINVAAEILAPGLLDIDAYAIWLFKAKILFTQPLRPIPAALLSPGLGYSHQDYPLDFPAVVAGLYTSIGGVNEQLGKLLLLPLFLSLAAIIYSTARDLLPRPPALAITALFISAPILLQNAGTPVAELPLVLMHACCLLMLLRWMQTRHRTDLIVSALFASFAAFTKNEGLALLPLIGIIALAFAAIDRQKKLWIDWLAATLLAILLLFPWLVYRSFLPHTHEDYGSKLTAAGAILHQLPHLTQLLPRYLSYLWQLNGAGPIWIVLAIVAGLYRGGFRRVPILLLWTLLLAHWALYLATFLVTPWNPEQLLPMVAPKLLMHITPLAAMLIALHLSDRSPTTPST